MLMNIGASGAGPYDGIGATLNVDYFTTTIWTTVIRQSIAVGGSDYPGPEQMDIAGGGNNEIGSNFQTRRPGGL